MLLLFSFFRLKQLIYILFIFLAACSQDHCLTTEVISVININSKWNHHQKLVKALTQYQAYGTLFFYSNNQKLLARFYWKQISPHHYKFLLTNLLGMTELKVEKEDKLVYIYNRGDECVVNEKNAEQIIYKLTGIMLSLKNVSQWIMGLPGDSTNFSLDVESHLRELSFGKSRAQLHISYLGYRKAPGRPEMPSRIELHQANQRIQLKLDK
ncbi:lipoprotein insertase outer membrane protein LolB [Candidatus Erwinia haradaeae]|uniref:Outer-membrane lipoprotein LolB n=1 Tax=Candidatus Erwinia haradaeae TaxID=1922217 RepID=A0A451DI09_9GAMM|nr:lipoprotein insertase outer membrane protein LolB [Candidatus Erwinia haradaeae]VFP86300.1 Outer-membrane lipoprotein LolB precursor [Candidatus Erwinia haradaeae]